MRAADVRYEVLHLQEAYGEEWFFTGMSPGGVITASSPTGIATVVGTDFRSFPYPFQNSTFLSTFGDSETMYAERVGTPENPMLEGISSIDRLGNVVDTGYVPRGTSMSLGRQNSLGTIVGDEEGGTIPGSAGFIYSPTTGAQSLDTLGGVNVTRFSAINNNDWIIGNGIASTVNGDVSGMFLWIPGEEGLLIAPGFGSPKAINDAGQFIGALGGSAFLWEAGNLQIISDFLVPDPGNPGVVNNATFTAGANDIGHAGDVLGFISLRDVPGFTRSRTGNFGWIWTEEEDLVLLEELIDPTLGFEIRSGRAIADDGTILASGRIPGSDEVQHFLLTPIPEPSAFGLLLFGLLLRLRRSR